MKFKKIANEGSFAYRHRWGHITKHEKPYKPICTDAPGAVFHKGDIVKYMFPGNPLDGKEYIV